MTILYEFLTLAMQIHVFLLHQKERLQNYARRGANLQQFSFAANIMQLLNKLSSSCLSADLLCAD
jgi:hypothetical protein